MNFLNSLLKVKPGGHRRESQIGEWQVVKRRDVPTCKV